MSSDAGELGDAGSRMQSQSSLYSEHGVPVSGRFQELAFKSCQNDFLCTKLGFATPHVSVQQRFKPPNKWEGNARKREARRSRPVRVRMSVEQPAPSLETEEDVTQWRVVIICALMAMFAAADRTIFSVASLPIATDFSLSMTTVGVLQSSFLFGYGVSQLGGGELADTVGGARILAGALLGWSIATAALPIASATPL
ncbi:hypothetical protein CYMTET_19379 [Cymbomonas tetramitiformis]|uniref:Major facilitator superfamily (MFS) profile domain-containing protein n=1 Tax=Cymbomonas tetramitiformis TaxID=36881 RepID=A0AAE0G6Q0_9CHLO|nr:hypothetical protein CYMTET_19379 [Cymbomonas tetramitiformis]